MSTLIATAIGMLVGAVAGLYLLRRIKRAIDREYDEAIAEVRAQSAQSRENFWRDAPAVDIERRER